MFEEFSSGYYLGRLYVEPYGGDRAAIQRNQHELVNRQLYDDANDQTPLVMKVENRHFPVHGEDNVPANTLAVPEQYLEDTRIRNPPELTEVLLVKADRAAQFLRYTGKQSDSSVGT